MNRRIRSAAVLAAVATAAAVALTASPAGAVSPDVVISQVYGGGGNSGATYTNDFIELYNRGTAAVDLAGWSAQYAAATGTSYQVTALSGSIAPGAHFLVQEAAGAGGTTPLPTPDVTGSIPMAAGSGKARVVSPAGAVWDFVGYGTANEFEGSGAAPALSNTTAALRAADGATDTDDNAADFTAGAPNPRSSGGTPPPPPPSRWSSHSSSTRTSTGTPSGWATAASPTQRSVSRPTEITTARGWTPERPSECSWT